MDFDIKGSLGRKTHVDFRVLLDDWLGKVLLQFGPLLGEMKSSSKLILAAKKKNELEALAKHQNIYAERISDEKIEYLSNNDFTEEKIDEWHQRFSSNPESNIQSFVVPLIESVLQKDVDLKSVINIGVKIAYFDSELAKKYPDKQFIGVDFFKNLNTFNRRYLRENLRLISGYARDLLDQGKLAADVVYFSSTATVIPNRELRKNLSNIKKFAQYVIFSEPIFTKPESETIVDPNKVPLKKSYLVFTPDIPPGCEPPPDPFRSLCFVHNYASMLEEAGYHVYFFNIVLKDNVLPMVQVIGKRRT